MGFLIGEAPIRRTLWYLKQGQIKFHDVVKVVVFCYNPDKADKKHEHIRDFLFWHLPQLQYNNRDVQITDIHKMTQFPYVHSFLESGKEVLIDLDMKNRDQIHEQVRKTLGKSDAVLEREKQAQLRAFNVANFGAGCDRHCMCEVQGQLPCTSVLKAPKYLRGEWRWNKLDS